MSVPVEDLDVSHKIYDALIKQKLYTLDEIFAVFSQTNKPATLLPELSNEDLVELSKAVQGHAKSQRDFRIEHLLNSSRVRDVIVDGVDWRAIVKVTVDAYEEAFGVGPRKPGEAPSEMTEAVSRVAEVMKRHGVGSGDD